MIRALNDPCIVEVLAVFERHRDSQHIDAMQLTTEYVGAILVDGYVQDGMLSGFSTVGLVALLSAFLQHAPEDVLQQSVAVARAQLAALLDSEHVDSVERTTGCAFASAFDYPTRLAHEMAAIRRENVEWLEGAS